MLWLECVRSVIDGSMDKRDGEDCYAGTPSRAVFLLMLSCSVSDGDHIMKSDVVRAYLNALSIDRNLVVEIPQDVLDLNMGFERYMLINKGVYGTKKGALSWEIFFDNIVVDKLGFKKCLIATSVYTKVVDGCIVRLLRHSDDVAAFGPQRESVEKICKLISAEIRMSEWEPMLSFLGAEMEYVDNVVLVRQTAKINEAVEKYQDVLKLFNPSDRVRQSPLPINALESDENLKLNYGEFINSEGTAMLRGIVGCIGWITTIRFDCKFAYHVIAGRTSSARLWDLYCAAWCLEFLKFSVDWPLVLGGPIIDLRAMTDASLAIMEERKSIKSNFMRTGPLSGAILAEVDTIRAAVTSIFDAEVMAASDGVDNLSYGINLLSELAYENEGSLEVMVDSESAIEWFNSKKIGERSRHLQLKYFHCRHFVQDGLCRLCFVQGDKNTADLLTKVVSVRLHRFHARDILGHKLIAGKNLRGEIVEDVEDA